MFNLKVDVDSLEGDALTAALESAAKDHPEIATIVEADTGIEALGPGPFEITIQGHLNPNPTEGEPNTWLNINIADTRQPGAATEPEPAAGPSATDARPEPAADTRAPEATKPGPKKSK